MMRKQKYAKPSAKVVEWDFNEAICNVITNSYIYGRKCFTIERGSGVTKIENRNGTNTGTWTRVSSRLESK